MGKFVQADFSKGMIRLNDPSKINQSPYSLLYPDKAINSAYSLLINGRNRFNTIDPIYTPLEIVQGLPPGKKQGMITAGNILIVFIEGRAWYNNLSQEGSNFTLVQGLQLDSHVDQIYSCLVPATTVTGIRKLNADGSLNSSIVMQGSTGFSPQCVICQDGKNQPCIINTDGTGRITQNYDQWSLNGNREYVPIGTLMLYNPGNGILYIIAPDGNTIYRSVTGRPLDFMVIIDINGDKIDPASGDASMVAHRVDFDVITAMHSTGSPDFSFLVCTPRNSYQVVPSYLQTVYGEPTFQNIGPLFNSGAINQFSVVDLLGDIAFVDYAGIISYNAVKQFRLEGRNSPFSLNIQNLFEYNNDVIRQTNTCATFFANYGLFSLQTIFGPAVLVYDTLTQCWVGIDIYSEIQGIKQMEVVKTDLVYKLIIFTTDNKFFEAFAGSDIENCSIYIGEFCSGDPALLQKPQRLRPVFIDVGEDGIVNATIFVDRQKGQSLNQPLKESITSQVPPFTPPFGSDNSQPTTKPISFDFGRNSQGWKIGFLISWNFLAKLSHISFEAEDSQQMNPSAQAAQEYDAVQQGLPTINCFIPVTAVANRIITVYGENLDKIDTLQIGKYAPNNLSIISSKKLTFAVPPTVPFGDYKIRLTSQNDVVDSAETLNVHG